MLSNVSIRIVNHQFSLDSHCQLRLDPLMLCIGRMILIGILLPKATVDMVSLSVNSLKLDRHERSLLQERILLIMLRVMNSESYFKCWKQSIFFQRVREIEIQENM
jgi:hypothetical protein